MPTSHAPQFAVVGNHWYGAAFLFVAAFINTLDATIVNLGLPSIQNSLSASDTAMQWVLVIYVMGFAAGLLPFGRFGDVFGRHRLFFIGLIGFVLASIWCGAAQQVQTLIIARGVKGVSAAIMLPQVLAIIRATFPAEDLGKAIGYFSMVSGFGAFAGPLIGGMLIALDLFGMGWRAIFWINVPLGLIALFGVLTFLPKGDSKQRIQADWLGSILFATTIAALLYPLIEGRSMGWPFWLIAVGVSSFVLLALFVVHQKRRETLGQSQLVPFSLIRKRRFLAGIIQVTLLFTGIAGSIVILAITLQAGFGLPPANAGIILAAHPLSAMCASLYTGRMGFRHLNARIFLGCLSLFFGMILLKLSFGEMSPGLWLWVPLILVGVGMGSTTVALFQSVLEHVPATDAGAGSGAIQAFQQIGIALGVALIGQVFFAILEQQDEPNQYATAIEGALWLPITIYAILCLAGLIPLLKESRGNNL